ncbi:glycosyltransferase [bacterium]|nr:glycosyltransferase [bacterium]
MKISIVTVVFNNEATIADCIESVLSQDYEQIEYIVIDGKSTDQTLNIINRYTDKIDLIISETDNGLYDAMNKGLKLATGDFIGTLNSDDFYAHNHVVSRVVDTLQNSNADSCYANLVYVDPKSYKVLRYWNSGQYQKKSFLYGWMPPHPTFFVKRIHFENLGYFNTNLINSADYELMLRFLYANNISSSYLNEVAIVMRTGGHSNMTLSNRLRANREDRKSWILNNIKPLPFSITIKFIAKIIQFFRRAPSNIYRPIHASSI